MGFGGQLMPRGYQPGRSVPARYPREYRDILVAASKRWDVPARVLAAQEFIESGYAKDVIAGRRLSSAQAAGISQFVPSTARTYGVHAGLSRRAVKSQVFGHAHYLHDLGFSQNRRRAIASYAGGPGNPQYGYAQSVLSLAPSYRGIATGVKGGSVSRETVGGSPGRVTRSGQQAGGTALAELAAKALERPTGPPSFTLPAAPVFSARVTLPQGQVAGPPQSGQVAPRSSGPSLAELMAAAQSDARVQNAKSTVHPGKPGRVVGGGPSGPSVRGKVRIAAGADRAGVPTRKSAIRFAEKVAGVYGHPLTVGTGTNHSQMTTTGSVSEHWSGHAVDIPLAGRSLTRAGHAALIAAGMPRAQARRAKGGIYNVGNHQIIFNTTLGGNHWDHLHVSTH